jgi:hypothetical protein
MPQSEARAWWADVEHVRETIERRRAAERHLRVVPDRSASPDPSRKHAAAVPVPRAQRPARTARRSGSAPGARRHPERRAARRPAGRRTVEITGRTVPAPALPEIGNPPAPAFGARGASRRPFLSPADRIANRPDRIALWAVVLGFVLIVVAATSS